MGNKEKNEKSGLSGQAGVIMPNLILYFLGQAGSVGTYLALFFDSWVDFFILLFLIPFWLLTNRLATRDLIVVQLAVISNVVMALILFAFEENPMWAIEDWRYSLTRANADSSIIVVTPEANRTPQTEEHLSVINKLCQMGPKLIAIDVPLYKLDSVLLETFLNDQCNILISTDAISSGDSSGNRRVRSALFGGRLDRERKGKPTNVMGNWLNEFVGYATITADRDRVVRNIKLRSLQNEKHLTLTVWMNLEKGHLYKTSDSAVKFISHNQVSKIALRDSRLYLNPWKDRPQNLTYSRVLEPSFTGNELTKKTVLLGMAIPRYRVPGFEQRLSRNEIIALALGNLRNDNYMVRPPRLIGFVILLTLLTINIWIFAWCRLGKFEKGLTLKRYVCEIILVFILVLVLQRSLEVFFSLTFFVIPITATFLIFRIIPWIIDRILSYSRSVTGRLVKTPEVDS